jgi:hypothetical protein
MSDVEGWWLMQTLDRFGENEARTNAMRTLEVVVASDPRFVFPTNVHITSSG